jgi:hypothetical protein
VVLLFAHHFLNSIRENMRIKIIGDNNCARATRHLLRLAGFAVTEYLPADAVTGGPLAGYAITIDLAPAHHTPDAFLRPDPPTPHSHASASEEAPRLHRDASLPSLAEAAKEGKSAVAPANFRSGGGIHFDSVDSVLEAAVLRHVTQLAAAPVIVDRQGGVVHSDRELRIVAPNTGDAKADEAAAVAIEFGVLRGLLDLTSPSLAKATAGLPTIASAQAGRPALGSASADESEEPSDTFWHARVRKWWPFGVALLVGALGLLRICSAAAPGSVVEDLGKAHRLKPVLLEGEPQGQFATGQGTKITDGTNFLVVDPCKGQTKLYASISQTSNTQLVSGTASKKIYVCSIHVVTAAATNIAVVEGTGSVCGTGTAGVSGFGGATAATGWNFAANGGIALGNGDSSLGAEGTSGDNLCVFNSGSGQVSGGISYVVQ